jgi:hypothetical protein
MKIDNCLVNSNDFKLSYNGLDLENDKPLKNVYISKSGLIKN